MMMHLINGLHVVEQCHDGRIVESVSRRNPILQNDHGCVPPLFGHCTCRGRWCLQSRSSPNGFCWQLLPSAFPLHLQIHVEHLPRSLIPPRSGSSHCAREAVFAHDGRSSTRRYGDDRKRVEGGTGPKGFPCPASKGNRTGRLWRVRQVLPRRGSFCMWWLQRSTLFGEGKVQLWMRLASIR